jgi:hypothetical protein
MIVSGCTDFEVSGCIFDNNGGKNLLTTEGYGLSVNTLAGYLGSTVSASGVGFSGLFLGAGNENHFRRSSNVTIRKCLLRHNVGKGVDTHGCFGFNIINNWIDGFNHFGIDVGATSGTKGSNNTRNMLIQGNVITNGVAGEVSTECTGIQAGFHGSADVKDYDCGFIKILGNTIASLPFPGTTFYGISVLTPDTVPQNDPYFKAMIKQVLIQGNMIQNLIDCHKLMMGIRVGQAGAPMSADDCIVGIFDNVLHLNNAWRGISAEVPDQATYLGAVSPIAGNVVKMENTDTHDQFFIFPDVDPKWNTHPPQKPPQVWP